MLSVTMSTVPNTSSDFHIQYSSSETIVQAFALVFIMFTAISANTMNILVVYRNSCMQTPRYMFILNLACGDLGVTLLSMPFCLVTAVARRWILGEALCQVHGFLGSFFFCASIFTLTIMSIEQYFALVKPLARAITIRRARGMILSVWVFSAFISMGPALGWGHFDFNSSTLACGVAYPRFTFERLYLLFLVFVAFVIPLLIMGFAFVCIFIAVKKHTARIAKHTTGGGEVMKLQRRITYTLLLVLVVFMLCWLPFVCLITLANQGTSAAELPHGLGVAAYWCGFFNSSVNPIIYVILNDKFREGYADILAEVWYGLRCQTPPASLKRKRFKKVWYVAHNTPRSESPQVALEAVRLAEAQEFESNC